MNDQQLDDLKQFFDTRLSQTETVIFDEMHKLRQDMQDGFAGIADIIEQINGRLDEHDHEIAELKQQPA